MKKKTHKEFTEEVLNLVGNEYDVIGNYIDSQTKIAMIHNKCGHIYDVAPNKFISGRRCPKCVIKERASKQATSHTEFLNRIKRATSEEYTVIGKYTNNHTKVLLRHNKCGYEWNAIPYTFYSGARCPKCSHTVRHAKIGQNDLWTTHPEIAKYLYNPDDGYRYSIGSCKKVDWICPSCNKRVIQKAICKVNEYGIACPYCSDGISYPEKVFANLLSLIGVTYERQKQFEWSGNYRYDFYFVNKNIKYIIESDGGYHFKDARYSKQKDVMINDKKKSKLLKDHNITLIRIDCKISDIKYIKKNILSSKLKEIFELDKIDWAYIDKIASVSLIGESAKLFNSGMCSTKNIASQIGISQGTVIRYLTKAAELKLCNYSPNENRLTFNKNQTKSVVAINGNDIKIFNSITEANIFIGHNKTASGISKCCKAIPNYKTAGGYKWMYYEDYINQQNQIIA